MPKKPRMTLATAEEIRALLDRAFVGLGWVEATDEDASDDDDGDERDWEAEGAEHQACMDAVRFCAGAAGLLGDASLAPLFADIADMLQHRDDRRAAAIDVVASGLATLVRRGAKLEPALLELAERREDPLRAALARTLPPLPAALPALEKLARDPAADVRNPARATLAKVREVAWWTGLFASDPLARMAPEEAERAKPDLERAATLLAMSPYEQSEHVDELAAIVRRLPEPLGIELGEQVLGSIEQAAYRAHPVGAALLDLSDGPEALYRLATKWTAGSNSGGRHRGNHFLGQILGLLPEERRAAACLALAAFAAKAPPGEADRGYESPAYLVATAVNAQWPAGADVAPLLELVLATEAPPEGNGDFQLDWAISELAGPIGKKGAGTAAVLDRLVEAYLAGKPGRFSAVPCREAIEHAPMAVLRATAERALVAEDEQLASWGLEQLLGPAHDPARDGRRAEVVARLWNEARTRRLMVEGYELRLLALPQLRAALRAGALDFETARNTLNAIGRLYGGLADTGPTPEALRHRGPPREDPLAKLGDVLDDPAFAGPPTDEEWERFRAVRAATPVGELWRTHLEVFPEGAWHPEDRAELERALAAFRADGDDHLAWSVAMALRSKPVLEDEPLFDALTGTEFDGYIRGCRKHLRAALGLPPLGGDADQDDDEGDAKGEDNWLDDDDDEEQD